MKPFDANNFEAMQAACYSRDEMLAEIHKHYEKQSGALSLSSERDGYSRGLRVQTLIEQSITVVVVMVVIGLCGMGISHALASDKAALAAQMTACKGGDIVGCVAAVQDQTREGMGKEATNRAIQYRLAYRLKTGQELPEK